MELIRTVDFLPAPIPVAETSERPTRLPDLLEALAHQPQDTMLAFQLGVRLVKQKRFDLASHILRNLLRRENCFEVLEAYATSLYNLRQWEECARVCRQALMLGEGFRDQRFELLKFLGNSLVQIKDLDGAQEAYEKAFLLFPGSDTLQVNFGTLWIQRGDWNLATECLRQALFLNHANDKAWVGLALCHRVRGDFDLAFGNVDRALDENAMNETALALMLDWCRDQAEFSRARMRFIVFTDAGGFNPAMSCEFIKKADGFGERNLARWEEFHMQIRGEWLHA